MASTADSTNIIAKWKDELKTLIITDFNPENTKEELGSGLYGEASIVNHNGVSYATKKIYNSLYSKDEFRKNFVQDCLLLSQLRHPCIVQFMGVQISDSYSPPVLITDLYPLSLATCLQRYPQIPEYSKYSILLETSVGISYLHQMTPPVVHGHICPNNILLTEGLHVKISDCIRFGASVSTPTNSPYQAPEGSKIEAGDVFSIGDTMLYVVLQKDLNPLEYKHHRNLENENEPVILTEVKRRERFLKELEETNQIKGLILSCLEEDPTERPTAGEITEELSKILEDKKPEYQNILEMFVALGQLSLIKDSVTSLKETVEAKEEEIEALKQQMEPLKLEIQAKEEDIAAEKEELEGYKQALLSKEGRIKAYETGLRAKEALIKAKDREIAAKKQVIATKESLLRSTNKRIEVLEQHVKASRKKGSITLHSLPHFIESKSGDSHSHQSSPDSVQGDSGLRPLKPYRGRSSPNSDGFKWSGITSKESDPRLAQILARQQQKLNENLERLQEGDSLAHPPLRKRSNTVDSTTPELRRILEKRKSFIEDDS